MRVELVASSRCASPTATPVRGRVGDRAVRRRAGWSPRTTHPRLLARVARRRPPARRRCCLPVEGHELFAEHSGTKHLKPDLEAAAAVDGGGVLLLGSRLDGPPGCGPSSLAGAGRRTRSWSRPCAALRPVARALGVPPDQLNLEGACVVGDAAALVPARPAGGRAADRQRRPRPRRRCSAAAAGRPTRSGRGGRRARLRPRRRRRGRPRVTDAVALPAASPGERRRRGQPQHLRRRTGGRLGARPARRRRGARRGTLPRVDGQRRQGRGAGACSSGRPRGGRLSRSSTPTTPTVPSSAADPRGHALTAHPPI